TKDERKAHERYIRGKNVSESILDDKLINQLIDKYPVDKVDYPIRLAYQYEKYGDNVYARTFEDAIALENFEMFKDLDEESIPSEFIKNLNSLFKVVGDVSKL